MVVRTRWENENGISRLVYTDVNGAVVELLRREYEDGVVNGSARVAFEGTVADLRTSILDIGLWVAMLRRRYSPASVVGDVAYEFKKTGQVVEFKFSAGTFVVEAELDGDISWGAHGAHEMSFGEFLLYHQKLGEFLLLAG